MSAGFGFINKGVSAPFAITVSDQIDYEISFWWQQPTLDPAFELSINCFNCDLSAELLPIDALSGGSQRVLIPGNLRICGNPNKWNFLHACIYSSNEPLHTGVQPFTSHAAGNSLIMHKGTQKMFVNLVCIKNCMLVWDWKVKPMRTNYSTGFIQSRGLTEIWRKNNKKDLSATQIDTLANEFLIPYDTTPVITEI
jgi:hypothetical protein